MAAQVKDALACGAAVVALESTIIAHGLPFPDNLDIARELEAAVRASGAVPATIAILSGRPCIGLDDDELARLARAGRDTAKAGAVDMARYMAAGRSAATTVSATATLAASVGIRVFATGGIGGVHRGESGDVSCDLTTLSHCPMAVVSAGAKAILDLPRTLEMLETLGVLVVGYQTDELPAFYTRTSGLALEHRLDTPEELARLMHVRFDVLAQPAGVVIANPIPTEAALEQAYVDAEIARALSAAAERAIAGKALTPFLLAALAESTGGRSVAANRALAVANARLAGQVANAYAAFGSTAQPS
jgi:pseudouridine-5'-phosphate glycosidase